jgi:transglutaminase-like putative cysteine protease
MDSGADFQSEATAMRVRVGCEFQFESLHPVTTVMLVGARADGAHRTNYESRWVEPLITIRDFRDAFSNACWRIEFPKGQATVRYDAVVDVDDEPDPRHPGALLVPPSDLPDEVLGFTLPSRYVESDQVANQAWELFGNTPPTWARVQAVCDWVHENIRYDPTAIVPHGTARGLLDRRAGVCRDFALLVTAFCRALNIPARYTFGYLPDIAVDTPDTPMDFHAWSEVYVAGRWHTFDARHNMPRIGRVVVGFGRDAADVAMTTSYGALNLLKMTVWAEEVAAAKEEPRPKFAPLEPAKPEHMTQEQLLGGGVR